LLIRRRSDDGPIRLQGAHSDEPEREKYEDRISVVRGQYDRLPVRAGSGADAGASVNRPIIGGRSRARLTIGLPGTGLSYSAGLMGSGKKKGATISEAEIADAEAKLASLRAELSQIEATENPAKVAELRRMFAENEKQIVASKGEIAVACCPSSDRGGCPLCNRARVVAVGVQVSGYPCKAKSWRRE
jgi:hypothetical protein